MGVKIPVVLDHTKEEDRKERDRLVRENMGLVYKQANDFYRGPRYHRIDTYPRDDAISDGVLALIHAAERFNPNYVKDGVHIKFSTYAVWWIRSWIQRGYMQSRLIYNKSSVSRWCFGDSIKFESLWHTDKSGDPIEVEDKSESVVDSMESIEMKDTLQNLLRLLDNRDRRVLEMRFFKGYTLQKIAIKLGVTRERVRQIQGRALERIRELHTIQQIRGQIA